ncbi:MAG: decaprenyl-phosphate phosphoribosyltransferase [Candidatus Auribacter fodinae]|jgi:4-hydroxybenzoate polyprenyltransferase|uniref:Decaprenyl-phosphate phosphoribosyltransferase n=1 Tax=Candidatus Auribacter fodinae TaxID=2093366 RepID=A0A3A4R081_9BACT|nr:MAG: decaprenyl-phosphate phosphoribosyltransferase [Candidatus Auribacter fodinae]
MVKDYIFALRPKQWIKNLFLFAALFFSRKMVHVDLTLKYIIAFCFFCLLTSSVYLINDIHDKEQDKIHPQKKQRPIAAGRISVSNAWRLAIMMTAASLTGAFFLDPLFLLLSLIYYIMNIFYSFWLKRIVIVDIFCIAIGFVLRVLAGSVIGHIYISNWLLICTFMLSLFLGFTKRRHELVSLDKKANLHRPILNEYSTFFLDQMIAVVTTSTVIFYVLYTVSAETVEKFHTDRLLYTTVFVIYGIFRYLYLVYKRELGGNPTIALLTDCPLLITIFFWVLSTGLIIYLQ